MPSFYDRVAETSVSNGTGNLTLQGAIVGYRRFFDAAGLSTPFYYVIENPGTVEFEIGEGYLSSPTTLVRESVYKSSNSNNAVAFTTGAKNVFSSVPADVVEFDQNYVHDQAMSSSLWTVTHNLNKYPSVTIVDTSNRVVIGQVDYLSANSLTVTFSASFSGKAYLN